MGRALLSKSLLNKGSGVGRVRENNGKVREKRSLCGYMVTSLLSLLCFFNCHLPNQDYAIQLYPMSVVQGTPTVCHRSYFLAGIDRLIHSPVDGHLGSHNVFFNTLDSSSLPPYIRESEIPNPMRILFPSVLVSGPKRFQNR